MLKKSRVLEITAWHLENAINYEQLIKGDREVAQYHYYGQWPAPPKANRSSHVSYDVLDAIETLKADFIKIFLSASTPLKFIERTSNDTQSAKLAWLYAHDVFTRQNKGSAVLHDAIFDALLMKIGVFRVCWEDKEITAYRNFKELTEPEFNIALSRPTITLDDVEITHNEFDQPLYTGTFIERIDKSKVKISAIPPENFLLPEQVVDDDEPDFMAERMYPMVSELLKEGYNKKDIDSLENYYASEEELRRNYSQDISPNPAEPYPDDSNRQRKIVYRCCILAEFDKKEELQYYEVIMGRTGPVLEINPIDHPGYFWWSPYRIAHKTIGLATADVVKHVQHAKTTLRRGLLDNVVGSNIPRRLVNRPMVKKVNQLTDNRIGGIVEVTDIDRAVKELPPTQINPATFNVLEMLDVEKEDRTGQTRLSQGTNSDVVSHQNSSDLVQAMALAGKVRESAQARLFADTCFAPMFMYIVRIGVQNETMTRLIPLMGEQIAVSPNAWIGMQFDMDTEVALLPEERKRDANNYMMLHGVLGQDPKLAAIYQDKNKYALLSDVCTLLGLPESVVLTSPDDPAYGQVKQAETQMQQIQMAVTQAQTGWLNAQQQSEIEKLMLEASTRAIDASNKQRELQLQEKEMHMKEDIERDKISNSATIAFAQIKQKRDDSELDSSTALAKAGLDSTTKVATAGAKSNGSDNESQAS